MKSDERVAKSAAKFINWGKGKELKGRERGVMLKCDQENMREGNGKAGGRRRQRDRNTQGNMIVYVIMSL